MSQLYIHENLVRIQLLVHKILCRQESVILTLTLTPMPTPMESTPKSICPPHLRWEYIIMYTPEYPILISEGQLSVSSERMCTSYWLTAWRTLPSLNSKPNQAITLYFVVKMGQHFIDLTCFPADEGCQVQPFLHFNPCPAEPG